MDNKRYVGTYYQESELVSKIDELRAQGHREDDLYVVVKDKSNLSMVRGETDAEVKETKASWLDRFFGVADGGDEVRHTFDKLGFSEEETARHHQDIENGGMVLLLDKNDGVFDDGRNDTFEGGRTSAGYGSEGNEAGNMTARDFGTGTGTGVTGAGIGATGAGVDSNRFNDMDDDIRNRTDLTDEQKLELHEERLLVNKERVQTGEVRVEKDVVEREERVDVEVEHDEVYVERRRVDGDRETTGHSFDATTDRDEIRVPVTEERVDVTKKDVVAEEIIVGKEKVKDTETVRETLRKEEAHIEGEDDLRHRDRDHDLDRTRREERDRL
ncbi:MULTISPECIES: YsnF/AvaK domain-containing protein [Exiguobacterium]|uniref:YsnF/AvaK domain-containing protein n=1 Tax=Exiguobacterium TaxID=33986 RepID=UPI001BEC43BB|nr:MULTISPECIES: YsnF/AvaK domain-containing protein [Exiguobacterium]MCT4775866.1 YsnF/AvaK domain-containing protein [Exiguobacterium aquaticum]MCT4789805.1 YsnF/AvaK domain-containing protein [Exiguobacterium mexicanum]